jgi:GH15 family glucan-1,4-alpha-glucosidase
MTRRLDHAVIGNGRVIALVSPTSAIEWLCMPRFDSPSVFGALLDPNGGVFRITAASGPARGTQRYLPNTNVAVTTFEAEDAGWEIVDFAPRLPLGWRVRAPASVVRIVRPLRGAPRVRVEFDPRPDYARVQPTIQESGAAIEVTGAGGELFELATNAPAPYVLASRELTLDRPLFFSFSHGRHGAVPTLASVQADLEETIEGWRVWAAGCALPLFHPDLVLRSSLCLKLHAYEETGAIIAAATTSIPEAMGTERTWDYRYCWLRDAAFTVEAMRRIGHVDEGERFLNFLLGLVEAGPLQPLYGIGGERDVPEQRLEHLAGFEGNGHVRIGNAAAEQKQHDVWGELVLCLHTLLTDPRIVTRRDPRAYFDLVQRLVREAIENAGKPDTSIWEFRSILRHYTFSRTMCWAAISRGALLASSFGEHELAKLWEAIAKDERQRILDRGFSTARGYFTQSLDGEHADASNLLLPVVGLLPANDPRFLATLDAYEKLLARDGYMLRYTNPDDFGATTSAFTTCSFWWAEALALAGRLDDAIRVFERIVAHANPLGLFSEDIEVGTGALLGNFPQAYTHVGLIHAATTIGALLEARQGTARAWSAVTR